MGRLRLCEQCRDEGSVYCSHRGVLLVYIGHAPVFVRGRTEQAARASADRLRIAWCGAPFRRPANA
jgi:hypothetical protein